MSKRRISIEDLRLLKFISDPQVSPNGEKIAFILSTINYDRDAYDRNIWMFDRASEEVEQFTCGLGADTYPRWSPNGRKLLFLSRGRQLGEKTQLWIISRFGGEARLAAKMEEDIMSPMWAPDSKQILFISRVWVEEKPKSDVRIIKRIKYRQNGVGTFEGRRPHVFTMQIGVNPKQITKGDFDIGAPRERPVAKWSPDGKHIAFITNMNDNADVSKVRDIFIMPSTGGEPKKITQSKYTITDLSWSPDGDKIAFFGHDMRKSVCTNTDLWVLPVEGGSPINITTSFDRSIQKSVASDVRVSTPDPGPIWSPNIDSIYFLTGTVPTANIYRVDIKKAKVEQLTKNKNVEGFSFSSDGSVLGYTAMNSTSPAELWIRDNNVEKRVTEFNDKLNKILKLSIPERYKFKNEKGEVVDGWIIKPTEFQPNKKYPTVLEIHGGPRIIYGEAMFHEFQVLASEGYVVLYTNPRGSSGYGEDYTAALMGHVELYSRDLMRFLDDALERFDFIDPERLGVTGGSFGGFTTYLLVTGAFNIDNTDRFKAAVACRAPSNRHMQHGTSDQSHRGLWRKDGAMALPWRDEENLLKISPIRYVANAKTPTLIIHSEKDLGCPISQAEHFFVALKEVGVNTELVIFPDENHELSRSGKPKHREERLKHILRWFNKYLE